MVMVTLIVFLMFAGQTEDVILQTIPLPSYQDCVNEVGKLDGHVQAFLITLQKDRKYKNAKVDVTCRIEAPVGDPA